MCLNKRFPTPPGSSHIRPIYNNEFLQVDPDTFQEVFAQDVDAVQARVMAAVQKPIAKQPGSPSDRGIWYLPTIA